MELRSRKDLPQFLNSLGLTDVAVEVGVYRGDFSQLFLNSWKGRVYNMVDPYEHQGLKLDRSDSPQEEHEANFLHIQRLVGEHNHKKERLKAQLWRMYSVDAASMAAYSSRGDKMPPALDFVYIDARHDYRSVWADLEAWYPLVKKGGILAGHDYKDSFVRKNLVEVRRAVDKFFYFKEEVHCTVDDNLPSWFVFKE